jgi:hypothetical protein
MANAEINPTAALDHSDDWPMRAWGLAILGGIVGFIIYGADALSDTPNPELLYATVAFFVVAGGVFAFTVEKTNIQKSIIFAAIAGVICGFAVYNNIGAALFYEMDTMPIFSAALAVGIAAPLFQAWCIGGMPWPLRRSEISYPVIHDYAWTNAVLLFAAKLFALLAFLLILLLGNLFDLLGIKVILETLQETWFIWPFLGFVSFGAVGLLRDRTKILITLQIVVRKILSVFAPVLAAGLILFLLAILFTGLSPLWDATKYTSAIILLVAAASITLANTTIGDTLQDETNSRILRIAAAALSLAILPLSIIAAVSVGLRISQYGYTPSRLWALIIVIIAVAYGIGYLVSILRARAAWMPAIRSANLNLAIGLCATALLLAMPLINFNAISTSNQLARLESGKVSVNKFDWAALRYDFGAPGRDAIATLMKSGKTPEIRLAAANANSADGRWEVQNLQKNSDIGADLKARITVVPNKIELPAELVEYLQSDNCRPSAIECIVKYNPGDTQAIVVYKLDEDTPFFSFRAVFENGKWKAPTNEAIIEDIDADAMRTELELAKQGKIEIRTVERRQIFIGDKPVGDLMP